MVARSPNESSSRGIGPCRAGTGLEESAMTTNRSAAPATIFSLVCAPPPPLTSQPSGATWSAPSMVRSNRSMLATSSIRRPSSRAACSVRGDVAAHAISSDLLARAGSRYATVEPVPSPTVMPFSTSSAAASAATCFSRSVFMAACLPGSAWKLSAGACPPVNLARIRVVACPDALVLEWASAVLDTDVTVLRGLRQGGSPWLLRAGDREVVMRVARAERAAETATEVAAMTCVARVAGASLPVAELLGYDPRGHARAPRRLPRGRAQPAGSGRLKLLAAVHLRLAWGCDWFVIIAPGKKKRS